MDRTNVDTVNTEPTHNSATLKDNDLVAILNIIDNLDVAKDYWSKRDKRVMDKLTDELNCYCKKLADILDLETVPSTIKFEDR